MLKCGDAVLAHCVASSLGFVFDTVKAGHEHVHLLVRRRSTPSTGRAEKEGSVTHLNLKVPVRRHSRVSLLSIYSLASEDFAFVVGASLSDVV